MRLIWLLILNVFECFLPYIKINLVLFLVGAIGFRLDTLLKLTDTPVRNSRTTYIAKVHISFDFIYIIDLGHHRNTLIFGAAYGFFLSPFVNDSRCLMPIGSC